MIELSLSFIRLHQICCDAEKIKTCTVLVCISVFRWHVDASLFIP
jgi:hypothetical protein